MLCFPFLFFFLHTRGWKSKYARKASQSSAGDCLDLEFMRETWTLKYTESVSTLPSNLSLSVQNQNSGTIIWSCWVFFFFLTWNKQLAFVLSIMRTRTATSSGSLIQASWEKQRLNIGKIISNWIHFSVGNVMWSSLSVQVPDWILLFKCTYYITAIQKGCKAHSEEM